MNSRVRNIHCDVERRGERCSQKLSAPPQLFFALSWILLMHGVDLQPSSGLRCSALTKVRRYLLPCLLWLRLPFAFYGDCLLRKNLASFNYASYYIITSLFQVTLLFNHKKIIHFVRTTSRGLTEKECSLLTAISCFFFLAIIMNALITTIFVSHESTIISRTMFLRDNSTLCILVGSVILTFDLIIFNALMIPMSLYCVAIGIYYFAVTKQISQLHHVAKMGYDRMMVETSVQIDETFQTFESLFSFCPLIWSIVGLLDATCNVIYLIEKIYKNGIVALSLAIFQQVLTISVLFFVSIVAKQINCHKGRIIRMYDLKSDETRKFNNFLMFSLNSAFDNQFSIWDMGHITRSSILTYLATIVTFSVLFVQIRNGALLKERISGSE